MGRQAKHVSIPTLREKNAAGWSDTEIARLLGVTQSTIAKRRYAHGIPVADRFVHTFERKHGPHAEHRFRAMVTEGKLLREIGAAFGFSREYARQVYNKLYQHPRSARHAS